MCTSLLFTFLHSASHPFSPSLYFYVTFHRVYILHLLSPLVFELFLVGVTGVSADFTLVNIAPTTNQVFSNPFTSTHTTHSSYTARSEFNYLDDKFYYDPNIARSLTLEQPSISAKTIVHSPTSEPSTRQSRQAQGKM
jgi:hypothetical protein